MQCMPLCLCMSCLPAIMLLDLDAWILLLCHIIKCMVKIWARTQYDVENDASMAENEHIRLPTNSIKIHGQDACAGMCSGRIKQSTWEFPHISKLLLEEF